MHRITLRGPKLPKGLRRGDNSMSEHVRSIPRSLDDFVASTSHNFLLGRLALCAVPTTLQETLASSRLLSRWRRLAHLSSTSKTRRRRCFLPVDSAPSCSVREAPVRAVSASAGTPTADAVVEPQACLASPLVRPLESSKTSPCAVPRSLQLSTPPSSPSPSSVCPLVPGADSAGQLTGSLPEAFRQYAVAPAFDAYDAARGRAPLDNRSWLEPTGRLDGALRTAVAGAGTGALIRSLQGRCPSYGPYMHSSQC